MHELDAEATEVTMLEGHANCDHVEIEDRQLCDPFPTITVVCKHQHREPIVADDGLGTGPTVGYHCECCDMIVRYPEWR